MANPVKEAKRRKISFKKPNALFEEWLEGWRDEAKEKGLQTHHTYNKALKVLQKYPVPFKSGQECSLLKNFGPVLCDMLDKRLAQYKAANPDDPRFDESTVATVPKAAPAKAAPRKKPAPTSPKKRKSPVKNKNGDNNLNDDPGDAAVQTSLPVFISAGQAQVKILVDCSETSAASTRKASQRATMKELQSRDIPFEIRDLSVGDFLWLAIAPDGSELVLPYIIERKRSDDLAHSIKGGRYHEQKMRLKACGLNVIYLIEATAAHITFPPETLFQAQTNTEIVDKFCVHNTSNVKETVSYLATMTRILQRKIKDKSIESCAMDMQPEYSLRGQVLCLYTYAEFKDGSAKIEDFTVREMFAQHLLQISGTSADAVCAIVQKFPTLALMREAFSKCVSDSEKIGLLTVLQFGSTRRSLPYEVAKRIIQFYSVADFNQM